MQIKKKRISQALFSRLRQQEVISGQKTFLLDTRYRIGTVINLMPDGEDVGLYCKVECAWNNFYKTCRVLQTAYHLQYNEVFRFKGLKTEYRFYGRCGIEGQPICCRLVGKDSTVYFDDYREVNRLLPFTNQQIGR